MAGRETVGRASKVDKALDRLRLLARIDGARLKGQAHRLRAHGLDDAARMVEQHVVDLEQTLVEMDTAIAGMHEDADTLVFRPTSR